MDCGKKERTGGEWVETGNVASWSIEVSQIDRSAHWSDRWGGGAGVCSLTLQREGSNPTAVCSPVSAWGLQLPPLTQAV